MLGQGWGKGKYKNDLVERCEGRGGGAKIKIKTKIKGKVKSPTLATEARMGHDLNFNRLLGAAVFQDLVGEVVFNRCVVVE